MKNRNDGEKGKGMKKRILFLGLIIIAVFAIACVLLGDGESSLNSYTVTFVQEGQEDVIKAVEKGESIEPPEIVAVAPTGYTYEWERTDFSAITKNITVRLKAVPNVYTVYYDIGKDSYASIESKTQSVTFNEKVSLLTPTRFGYKFVGWVYKEGGEAFVLEKYTVAEDTYLVAKWLVDSESDRWFTPDF